MSSMQQFRSLKSLNLEVASNAHATGVRFSDIVIGACLVVRVSDMMLMKLILSVYNRFVLFSLLL